MTRTEAIERALRAIARRVLGEDHSISALASLDTKHDDPESAPQIPADAEERLVVLEDFARTVADQVNRCNADILAARQEISDLTGKLKAVSDTLDQHWHPINNKVEVA